ncbi:MAG: DNA primase [Actinomycetota bacterium]
MARIKEEDIDRLRETANIVDIVSGYTQLKKSGSYRFVGLCPFHTEKTPSFQVDSTKGLWHCFGQCGEGGNLYQFIQKAENLPFPEAVEWLARKSGFVLHYEEGRSGEQQDRGLRARLIAANDAAARFFHDTLFNSPDALEARRYLENRGFGKDVAERWLLGYAPGRDALCRYLQQKGFTPEEIVKADLGRRSDKDGSLFDFFRQRITFPTWNLQGDVVAFGARAMGDQQPKYLNTSDTPVFQKSRLMYGLDKAKSAIARGAAVVVEGYTDVIALHEAGIKEAVATNGVALSDPHFELLKKFSSRAVLMFDADEAGKGATERGFGIHHRIGLEVLVAPLPSGRDPADVVSEDGPDAIQKVIDAAQPLLDFKVEQTIAKLPLDTPEARSVAVREVALVLGWHPDPIARHEYAFSAARRIGVDVEVIHRALSEQRSSQQAGGADVTERDRRLPGHVKVEREALQLLLTRPAETIHFLDQVAESDFTAPARRELFTRAAELARSGEEPGARLAQELSPETLALFTELSVGGYEHDRDVGEVITEVFTRVRLFSLEREIKTRRNTLQDVNPVEDPARHDQLFTELVGLEAHRRDLHKQLRRDTEEGAA